MVNVLNSFWKLSVTHPRVVVSPFISSTNTGGLIKTSNNEWSRSSFLRGCSLKLTAGAAAQQRIVEDFICRPCDWKPRNVPVSFVGHWLFTQHLNFCIFLARRNFSVGKVISGKRKWLFRAESFPWPLLPVDAFCREQKLTLSEKGALINTVVSSSNLER